MTLQFVGELPGCMTGTQGKTEARARQIIDESPLWTAWPSKANRLSIARSLEPFGPGFEVVNRRVDGKTLTFVRYLKEKKA